MVRLEQHRRVLAGSEEYQIASRMNVRELRDVEDDVPTIILLLLVSSSSSFAAAATTTTPPLST